MLKQNLKLIAYYLQAKETEVVDLAVRIFLFFDCYVCLELPIPLLQYRVVCVSEYIFSGFNVILLEHRNRCTTLLFLGLPRASLNQSTFLHWHQSVLVSEASSETSETKHHSFPPCTSNEIVSVTSRASQCRQNQISSTFADTFEVYFVKCFDLRLANSIRFIVVYCIETYF